jgi:hypothetical protein
MSYSIFQILYPKFSINPQEVRVFSTSLEKIMCATRRKSVFFRIRRVFNVEYVSIENPESRTEKSLFLSRCTNNYFHCFYGKKKN